MHQRARRHAAGPDRKRRTTELAAALIAATIGLLVLDGSTPAFAATTVVDDRVSGVGNNQFQYGDGWLSGGLTGMWESTDHYTSRRNATVQFRFQGTDVQLTGTKALDLGTAQISIDGGPPTTVSQRTTGARTHDAVFFDANGTGALPDGQHTLTLTTTSTQTFTLDRSIVTSGQTSSPVVTGTTAPTSTAAPAGGTGVVRTPEDFGANGNDQASDSAGLQAALNALRSGETLHIAAGKVYRHDRVLVVPDSAAGAKISGSGTITATVQERSALKVYAPNFRIDGITRRAEATTSRGHTEDHHSIFVNAPGYRSADVTIDGSHAAGYFFFGASDFVVERPIVRNTRADGIHMTYGSHHGRIVSPLVQDVGDDGVAIVSYAQAGFTGEPVSHHIDVVSPRVERQNHGRGLSVVGGEDVTFTDVHVSGSAAAGVMIGVETNTNSVRRVKVIGGELVGSNHRADIDHGAVFLVSSRPDGVVEDVRIEGLALRDTANGRGSALKTSGSTGTFARILLKDFTTHGGRSVEGFYPDDSIPVSSYGAVNWTGVDGRLLADRGAYRG